MRFIETAEGFVNLDHVAEIRVSEDAQGAQRARFIAPDGRTMGSAWGRVESHHFEQLIVAPPDYFIVHVWVDDEGTSVWKDPVIAFRIGSSHMTPLSLDGAVSGFEGWAIERPDGKVVVPGDREYDNVSDFEKSIVAERAARLSESLKLQK